MALFPEITERKQPQEGWAVPELRKIVPHRGASIGANRAACPARHRPIGQWAARARETPRQRETSSLKACATRPALHASGTTKPFGLEPLGQKS